ncbi:unnamed protein product [Urochloa humidicola]
MASQAWIAERAIPLLKKKSDLGAADIKSILEDKYNIEIKYQTTWYGRQRAADKLFGKWEPSCSSTSTSGLTNCITGTNY